MDNNGKNVNASVYKLFVGNNIPGDKNLGFINQHNSTK